MTWQIFIILKMKKHKKMNAIAVNIMKKKLRVLKMI